MAPCMRTVEELRSMPALTLAYIGDAVFELMIRERLLEMPKHDNGTLHTTALKYVSATAQSEWADVVLPLLTEEETSVYMRGRNAKLSVSKKNSPITHHKATAFEALIGWLYLSGRSERLEELIGKIPL